LVLVKPCVVARISVLATILLVVGCGSAVSSGVPTAAPRVSNLASGGTARSCWPLGSVSTPNPVHYPFATISIPPGADACQDVGSYGDPQPLQLTNDGPVVAFNARDFANERNLWLGDLRSGPIPLAYVAPETPGKKVDIWWPQLAGGQLVWIEYAHSGPDVQTSVASWTVKRMDVSSKSVTAVAQDHLPGFGGKKYVDKIRWDGHTLAVGEALANDSWQIELWSLSGAVQYTIPVDDTLYDMALTDSGIIYSAGVPEPANDAIGRMRLFRWTPESGSVQIGAGAFNVAASGSTAAWLSDPDASANSTGYPISQRVVTAQSPFTTGVPISPAPSAGGTAGVDAVACGSGFVLWMEVEGPRATGRDVLTAWHPGWSAPVQIVTDGDLVGLSVRNGWIVWFEYDSDNNGRLRGAPTSILPG
jgi:hypothetical protein